MSFTIKYAIANPRSGEQLVFDTLQEANDMRGLFLADLLADWDSRLAVTGIRTNPDGSETQGAINADGTADFR